MSMNSRTFTDLGEFEACRKAETWLKDRGFSVGRMQGPDPRGILLGDFDIQKWRNLHRIEQEALHATMTGSMRNGPVMVALCPNAPLRVVAAFTRDLETIGGETK